MKKSAISSRHHYYVFFYDNKENNTESTLTILNPHADDIHEFRGSKGLNYHIQIELPFRYGSETLLESNKLRNGNYFYDFYLGYFEASESNEIINYFCYPYKQLDSDLSRKYFKYLFNNSKYFTPKIDTVLEYLKHMNEENYTKIQRENIKIDVLKYSADLYEGTAKSVSLLGNNPLKSTIYDTLLKTDGIKLDPVALKLEFSELDNSVELLFDAYGNYRLWIHKDTQYKKMIMMNYVFRFFEEIQGLNEVTYLSKQTKSESND